MTLTPKSEGQQIRETNEQIEVTKQYQPSLKSMNNHKLSVYIYLKIPVYRIKQISDRITGYCSRKQTFCPKKIGAIPYYALGAQILPYI